MKHKHSHIEIVNKRSSYNNIYLKPKSATNVAPQQVTTISKADQSNSLMRQQF